MENAEKDADGVVNAEEDAGTEAEADADADAEGT